MSATKITLSPEAILNAPFPSYHRPLGWAHDWVCCGDAECKKAAVVLLKGLYERYDHAVAVGQELVLALMENGRDADAKAALEGIDTRFSKLDEELLCRWGRFYKDHGDRYIGLPWLAGAGPPNPREARPYYLQSLQKYIEAYGIRQGHYPGINQATLRFLLGTLVSPAAAAAPGREVADAPDLARSLLERRDRWPEFLPNDRTVWHPAIAAEAHLLLQDWNEAAGDYDIAVKNCPNAPRDVESMGRQAVRILMGWHHAGVPIPGPFSRLDIRFPGMPNWSP
ncbi:MAG: tetratricopeptide repeat-containing protein [Isosphaeraceae bacterium]